MIDQFLTEKFLACNLVLADPFLSIDINVNNTISGEPGIPG